MPRRNAANNNDNLNQANLNTASQLNISSAEWNIQPGNTNPEKIPTGLMPYKLQGDEPDKPFKLGLPPMPKTGGGSRRSRSTRRHRTRRAARKAPRSNRK